VVCAWEPGGSGIGFRTFSPTPVRLDSRDYRMDAKNYSDFRMDAKNYSDYGFVTPDYSDYGKVT
jgi:hypothetical protein